MSQSFAGIPQQEVARLERELDEAEGYEQWLRARIVEIRDTLAAGDVARALSLCNGTLNEIDNATDVVARSPVDPSAHRE